MSLPESRKSKIAYAPKTLERINGALHMAYLLSREYSGSENANIYFRSALCEFSSINDIAKSEIDSEQPLLNTSHPLPHILKLLRNTQVHVSSFALDNPTMSLVLGIAGSTPVTCSKWIIADISEEDLLRLDAFTKNRPHYTKEDATRMIEWLNHAQSQFGIPDLIRRAIEIFIDTHEKKDSLTV